MITEELKDRALLASVIREQELKEELIKKDEELKKLREHWDELWQLYSRLGVEAFGPYIQEEAIKEIARLQQCEECKESNFKTEELANLDYHIIKFTYPRLKNMAWYRDELKEERNKLLNLMSKYLDNKLSDEQSEKMFKLYGKLLPYMWN